MRNFRPASAILFPLSGAMEPVGGVGDGVPIHPDAQDSTPQEMWEEQVRKRRRDKVRRKAPERRPPDPEHQIDEYAH